MFIHMLLDLGNPFFSLEMHLDDYATTPLLYLCSGMVEYPYGIQALLTRGASTTARNSGGETCLHVYKSLRFILEYEQLMYSQVALLLLIDYGADVFAENKYGVSVSDDKYSRDSTDARGSSCEGDIWDSVLALQGYDIAEFRQGWPRVGKYYEQYTRETFAKLWEGNEHLCPYYDVPEGEAFYFGGFGDGRCQEILDEDLDMEEDDDLDMEEDDDGDQNRGGA